MLHESPRSSVALQILMSQGPPNVTMLAFDTPGCGESEPLAVPHAEASDYADAFADTLTALGVGRAVVYGTHTGAAIAMAFAVQHPRRVARLVIYGIGVFDAAERAEVLGSYLPPFVPAVDGTHLVWLWSRLRDQYLFFPWNHRGVGARLWRPLPEPAYMQFAAIDFLRAGDNYRAPYAAAFRYRPDRWLSHLRVPVFIGVRTDDMLLSHLDRLGEVPGNVRVERLSAERSRWGAALWAQMQEGTEGLPDAGPAPQPALPAARLANAFVDCPPGRLHLRGTLGGTGRPLVLLHDSPGGARGLDRQARAVMAQRPVLAPDLPAHGDSDAWPDMDDARSVAAALHEALSRIGLREADVEGRGVGSRVAAAMAQLHPRRYHAASADAAAPGTAAPGRVIARHDGGHLLAAWFHARDEAILGPWWSRTASDRHDFGDELDIGTIHARTIDRLKEAPQAAALRAALLAEATGAGRV
ncbi:hypothetical protein BH11PSE13_BH11PSE13_38420 [soil metagenome]